MKNALVSILFLCACGGGTNSNDSSLRTEANNGQCVVSTGKMPGDACSSPSDCVMGCCACAGSSKHYSAAACVGGVCLTSDESCARAKSEGSEICD